MIVSVSPQTLPNDGLAIKYDSFQLQFVNEPHYNPFRQLSDYNSSDTEAVSEYVFVDSKQPLGKIPSAGNNSIWAEWLRHSGRAPS